MPLYSVFIYIIYIHVVQTIHNSPTPRCPLQTTTYQNMAPSKESEALTHLFKQIASNFPSDNPFVARALYDKVNTAAAECPGVTYSEDVIAGRPALWVRPMGATPKKVSSTQKRFLVVLLHFPQLLTCILSPGNAFHAWRRLLIRVSQWPSQAHCTLGQSLQRQCSIHRLPYGA